MPSFITSGGTSANLTEKASIEEYIKAINEEIDKELEKEKDMRLSSEGNTAIDDFSLKQAYDQKLTPKEIVEQMKKQEHRK